MCLSLCLYAALYISHPSYPVSSFKYDGEKVIYEPVDTIGNVTFGLEHKSGFFVEIDHSSDPSDGNDRGWEEYKFGIRKTVELF